jgi:hypothetical protein
MVLDEKKYLATLEGRSIEDCKVLLFMQKANYRALSNGDQSKFTSEEKHIRLTTLTNIIRRIQLLNDRIRKIEDANAAEVLPSSFKRERLIDDLAITGNDRTVQSRTRMWAAPPSSSEDLSSH